MSSADRETQTRLWRRWRAAAATAVSAGDCPDPMTIAAHLDGRTTPGERERLEHHLASCPACLEALIELRAAAGDEPAPLPGAMRERALSLVPAQARAPWLAWLRLLPRLVYEPSLLLSAAGYGTAVVAIVLAGWAGLTLGRDTFEKHQLVGAALASSCTFDLQVPPPVELELKGQNPGGSS